jgi:hypothetical protein
MTLYDEMVARLLPEAVPPAPRPDQPTLTDTVSPYYYGWYLTSSQMTFTAGSAKISYVSLAW